METWTLFSTRYEYLWCVYSCLPPLFIVQVTSEDWSDKQCGVFVTGYINQCRFESHGDVHGVRYPAQTIGFPPSTGYSGSGKRVFFLLTIPSIFPQISGGTGAHRVGMMRLKTGNIDRRQVLMDDRDVYYDPSEGERYPHKWGYLDTRFEFDSPESVRVTGNRYPICGYSMPNFLSIACFTSLFACKDWRIEFLISCEYGKVWKSIHVQSSI